MCSAPMSMGLPFRSRPSPMAHEAHHHIPTNDQPCFTSLICASSILASARASASLPSLPSREGVGSGDHPPQEDRIPTPGGSLADTQRGVNRESVAPSSACDRSSLAVSSTHEHSAPRPIASADRRRLPWGCTKASTRPGSPPPHDLGPPPPPRTAGRSAHRYRVHTPDSTAPPPSAHQRPAPARRIDAAPSREALDSSPGSASTSPLPTTHDRSAPSLLVVEGVSRRRPSAWRPAPAQPIPGSGPAGQNGC
jgi:hypothetical protein